jgi:prepilin-type N-terminal cleavage/methylation domain-containing protein
MAIALRRKVRVKTQLGFTILEVMVAIVVLTIGILSVATVFSSSLLVVKFSEEDTIARLEAQQMIEGIFAGRNSGALPFSAIQNQSVDPANGKFKDGLSAAFQPGPDGIMNTLDDGPGLDTGPDGKPLSNFQRQIQITPVLLQDGVTVDPNTRKVQILVQYQIGNMVRTYSEVTYISTYR